MTDLKNLITVTFPDSGVSVLLCSIVSFLFLFLFLFFIFLFLF